MNIFDFKIITSLTKRNIFYPLFYFKICTFVKRNMCSCSKQNGSQKMGSHIFNFFRSLDNIFAFLKNYLKSRIIQMPVRMTVTLIYPRSALVQMEKNLILQCVKDIFLLLITFRSLKMSISNFSIYKVFKFKILQLSQV